MNVKPELDGNRCRVYDTGRELKGIYSLNLKASPGTLPRITIEALSRWFEAEGRLVYNVAHPVTGTVTEVRSITFVDGSVWPAVEASEDKCPRCSSTDRSVRGEVYSDSSLYDFRECPHLWHQGGSNA